MNEHTKEIEEDCAPFMRTYNCEGKCANSDCKQSKNTIIWYCELTTHLNCINCKCVIGCNA